MHRTNYEPISVLCNRFLQAAPLVGTILTVGSMRNLYRPTSGRFKTFREGGCQSLLSVAARATEANFARPDGEFRDRAPNFPPRIPRARRENIGRPGAISWLQRMRIGPNPNPTRYAAEKGDLNSVALPAHKPAALVLCRNLSGSGRKKRTNMTWAAVASGDRGKKISPITNRSTALRP
jgi:hypothetical protein